MDILFDPLFVTPWITGLCLSILLPIIGIYLRLRDEWLAALGLAQMSAACSLIGYGFGIPIFIAGPIGGMIMAYIKYISTASNTAYALMILAGWAITFIVAANTTLGESLGHALVDGQLYFIQTPQAWVTALTLLIGLPALKRMSPYLLRAKLFPHFESLNESKTYRWHMGFDALVACAMGIATASIGLMTAFAMVFIPPWLAFRIASGWKVAIGIAIGFNLLAYMMGFAAAILFDQPYGPMQVCVHLVLAGIVTVFTRAPGKNKARRTEQV